MAAALTSIYDPPANTRAGHDRERTLDRCSLQDCVCSRTCQAAQAPQFNAAVLAAAVISIFDPLANTLGGQESERPLGRSGVLSLSKPTSVTKPDRSHGCAMPLRGRRHFTSIYDSPALEYNRKRHDMRAPG